MLKIRTTLKEVPGKGIGLFAAEFIPKGTLCWKHDDGLDQIIFAHGSESPLVGDFIDTYGCQLADGSVHICLDNARFINHSKQPNVRDSKDNKGNFIFTAIWDIHAGDEILTDYSEICELSKINLGFDEK